MHIPKEVLPATLDLTVYIHTSVVGLLTWYFNHSSMWPLEGRKGHVHFPIPEPTVLVQCLTHTLPSGCHNTRVPWSFSSPAGHSSSTQLSNVGFLQGPVTSPIPILSRGSNYYLRAGDNLNCLPNMPT